MQFFDAVKIVFKKYADFRGTATRPEYWWFTLFVFLVGLIAGAFDMAIRQDSSGPIQSLVSIALFLPQLTVMVRRNRDAGFSAWWLTTLLLPVALVIYGIAQNPEFISQIDMELSAYQTQEEAILAIIPILSAVFGPALLAALAVGLFFFVVSLLPSKKKQQPVVATIDY
ncbi:MAG: hypothetical protein RIS31_621 [Actinomycetota bacterium]|jgi:uncharacterized membrane protein YhaH (DUF805 family)